MKITNLKKLFIAATALLVLFAHISQAAKYKSKNQESAKINKYNKESILSAAMDSDDKKDNAAVTNELPKIPLAKTTVSAPAKKASVVAKPANPMFGKAAKAPSKKGNFAFI